MYLHPKMEFGGYNSVERGLVCWTRAVAPCAAPHEFGMALFDIDGDTDIFVGADIYLDNDTDGDILR